MLLAWFNWQLSTAVRGTHQVKDPSPEAQVFCDKINGEIIAKMCKTGKNPLKHYARLAGRRMSEVQRLDCEPICAKNLVKGDPLVMDELFEIGKDYVFYFYYGNKAGFQHIGGQVVSYEHPLVKIETAGLLRVINCASSSFIEAVSRNQSEALEQLVLEKDSA